MAEETTADLEAAVENADESAPHGNNMKENRRDDRRRDDIPVEELFDLSQPIPRVERPSKEAHEAEVAEIGAAIDNLKEKRQELQTKIDDAMDGNRNSEMGSERDALSELRAKKGALINEKKSIRARLDQTRDQTDRLIKDRKDARISSKYNSVEDIDKAIAALQRRQETTSMSLAEEKKLIKDMEALQSSKKVIADLGAKESKLEDVKVQRQAITADLKAKDKEIDDVQKEIEERSAKMDALREKETGNREAVQKLFQERDNLKAEMNEKLDERTKVRQAFREANNAWYNYQRAVRAQKRMKYEEERKKKDEERAAWLKKKEEEEMKKVPYEEEMALCDYLADYLTRTYLSDGKKDDSKKADNDVVAVKDDPFAGFKPIKKNDDEVFLKMGKGKKKRVRQKKAKAESFTLNVDSFEQFGFLNLTPPTNLDMVQKSVDELRAKKKWYSEQPRGSVPTAQEIRKANEKNATKLRNKEETNSGDSGTAKSSNAAGKKGGAFSLESDDFVPLGGTAAASSSMNSSWGQKQAEEDSKPAADETVEEDGENGEAAEEVEDEA